MTTATRPIAVGSTGLVVPSDEPEWNQALSAAERRRSPRIWQIASLAVSRALDGVAESPRSIVVATALGALDETRNFLELVFTEGHGSPRSFIASVHNSMAGKLAQDLGITGPNLTICDGQNSFASALGAVDLLSDADFPTLLVVVDENIQLLEQVLPFLSTECRSYLRSGWHDGAVAFLCRRAANEETPTLRAAGPVTVEQESPENTCQAVAAENFGASATLVDLSTSSSSYLQPALTARGIVEGRDGRHVVVPSYAPTVHAVAAVEVCA